MSKRSLVRYVELAKCYDCPLNDRPLVPGYGETDHPLIAFVAEAPGQTEVERGIPLIGKAGQFLRRVMGDLGIPEDDCYFTNVCLCHPKGNAKPTAEMARACQARLAAELASVQPNLIVTLGTTPVKYLAQHKLGITRSHGYYTELEFKSKGKAQVIGVVPTFHPSYMLRSGKGADAFRDFVYELELAKGIANWQIEPIVEPPYENYNHITTQEDFESFIDVMPDGLVACDIETDRLDWISGRLLCIGFSWEKETAHVIDWDLIRQDYENLQLLNDRLKDVKLALHNGIFDIPFMKHNGLTNAYYYLDTLAAHFLLDERQMTHGLERLAVKYYQAPLYKTEFREYLGLRSFVNSEDFAGLISKAEKEVLFDYNGADTDYTFRLAVDLVEIIKEEGQLYVLKEIEMPACRVFAELAQTGILVDREYLESMGSEWRAGEAQMLELMKESVGDPEFNPNSPKQLSDHMYDTLKLEPFGGREMMKYDKIDEEVISKAIQEVEDPEAREYWTSKRTAMHQTAEGHLKGISPRTTQAYMLHYLKLQHEFPNWVLEWRHYRKRLSLYYDGLKDYMAVDGRVRPRYEIAATRTGRKATKDPALHNLPRGDVIYDIFISDPGWCNIHSDYKQAEMRMMAHYSGDKNLLHVLQTTDIHTVVAMEIFGLTEEDVANMPKTELSDKRISSKMITFGLPYGRSAAGLAPQLGVTVNEAKQYINTYFSMFPDLKKWLTFQRARGVKDQEITNVFGRKRRFPLITDRSHKKEVERQAGNMAIQSTINDLTLLAYSNSILELRKNDIPVQPWCHVHDSINFSVPKPYWVRAVEIIIETMERKYFESEVDFPSSCEIGDRWGGMITVHDNGEWIVPDPDDETIPGWILDGFYKNA